MKKRIVLSLSFLVYAALSFAQWSWVNPLSTGEKLNAVQFCTADIGYASGDCNTLLKTTDGGVTWNLLADKVMGNMEGISFINENIGYVISNTPDNKSSVYKTLNGGLNWERTILPTAGSLFSITFLDETTGFVSGDKGTVFKTTDSGNTWQDISIDNTACMNALFFLNPNLGFSACVPGIIYKTTDGGLTWSSYSTGYCTEPTSVFFLNENIGFIVGQMQYILKTIDGGLNWFHANTEPISSYSIHFFNENDGIAECNNGDLIKTEDGGTTWTTIPFNEDPENFNAFSFYNELCGVIVGYNGSNFKTIDGGNNWECSQSLTGYDLNDVVFISDSTGFIGGKNRTMLKTTDLGNTWQNHTTSVNGNIVKFDFPSQSTGYLISDSAYKQFLYKSTDGGETWNILTSHNKESIIDIFFLDELNGYLTSGNEILHTMDGGDSWSVYTYTSISNFEFHHLFFATPETGYVTAATTYVEFLYKTSDGGQSWKQVLLEQINFVAVTATSEDVVYMLTLYAGLFKSTDGGISWEYSDILYDMGAYAGYSLHFNNNEVGYFVGLTNEWGRGVIFKTNDGGSTWHESLRTSAYLNRLCFSDSGQTGFVVGENGSILKTVNAGGNVPVKRVDQENQRISISPNPTCDVIKLTCPQSYTGKARYIIYDSRGRFVDERDIFINNQTEINVSGFQPGLYLIRVQTAIFNAAAKFVVQ